MTEVPKHVSDVKGYPPLGSGEHFAQFARESCKFSDSRVEKLYEFMAEHRIAESIAYFIMQNDTPLRGKSERLKSIDTRTLPGYNNGPIVHAEFKYDPWSEERYVYLAGRRELADPRIYNVKMFLKNDLELDTTRGPEAYALGGKYPHKTFRLNTFPEYDEQRPVIFLQVLGVAMTGLKHFIDARDNS